MFIIINFGDGTRNIFSADLGAVINSDLSFKDYKKTNSIIAIIYRSLLSPKLHQQLIVRLKQPIFEYTQTGWSPVQCRRASIFSFTKVQCHQKGRGGDF